MDNPENVLHMGQSEHVDMDLTVHAWGPWDNWKNMGSSVHRFVTMAPNRYLNMELLENMSPTNFNTNVSVQLTHTLKELETLEQQQ